MGEATQSTRRADAGWRDADRRTTPVIQTARDDPSLQPPPRTTQEELREEDESAEGSLVSGERKVERWLLNDWMDPKTSQKAAALPLLPKSKFNSGDNPILAATLGIMLVGVVFSVLGL